MGKRENRTERVKPIKAAEIRSRSKDWIETLVVSETVRRVLVDEVIEMIADRVIELQNQERDKSVLRALELELEGVKKSIANLIKAVELGIFTESTQARLLELEKEKKDLEARIAHEEIVTPKVTREQVVFWLNQFKGGDIDDPEYQRLIIDVSLKRFSSMMII